MQLSMLTFSIQNLFIQNTASCCSLCCRGDSTQKYRLQSSIHSSILKVCPRFHLRGLQKVRPRVPTEGLSEGLSMGPSDGLSEGPSQGLFEGPWEGPSEGPSESPSKGLFEGREVFKT